MYKGKAINLLLAEDIERCENYLSDHSDEALGQKLYIDITSRYDGIISGLGNGLYCLLPSLHGEWAAKELNPARSWTPARCMKTLSSQGTPTRRCMMSAPLNRRSGDSRRNLASKS